MELNFSTSLNEELIKRHGNHETQELEATEADPYHYGAECKKDHTKYIPIDKFDLKNLPVSHQDQDLYKYIMAASDLTVRICVTKPSPERPKCWPGTTEQYPFHNSCGSIDNRYGTGRVWFVNKFQEGVKQYGGVGETDYKKCWCTNCKAGEMNSKLKTRAGDCKTQDSASNVWWEFYVYTAAHVVFDETEASNTRLRLFFDTQNCQKVIVETCILHYVNIEKDVCKLKCVTCDKNIGEKLRNMWTRYRDVSEIVNFKYSYSRKEHKLTFIVSHPHGCSKYVSVGHWKEKLDISGRITFTYTAPTCRGSSGANVQCVGYNDGYFSHLLHSGSKSGLNYSGACVI